MFESNKKLTVEEIKGLYPNISLIEGYDEALVGVVTAPNDEFVPVYDTFVMIDIIARMGFKSKSELNSYFSNLVSTARGSGFGPLFMQSVKVKSNKDKEDPNVGKVLYFDEEDDEKNSFNWEKDLNSDSDSDEAYDSSDSEELPFGYAYAEDSDSGSDYDILEDNSEEFDDEYDDEDDDDTPFMQITMHIGANDPKMCRITSNPNKVKDALFMLFPNLTKLDLIKEIKFYFKDDDEEGDED
jgi:hypothetical protein